MVGPEGLTIDEQNERFEAVIMQGAPAYRAHRQTTQAAAMAAAMAAAAAASEARSTQSDGGVEGATTAAEEDGEDVDAVR